MSSYFCNGHITALTANKRSIGRYRHAQIQRIVIILWHIPGVFPKEIRVRIYWDIAPGAVHLMSLPLTRDFLCQIPEMHRCYNQCRIFEVTCRSFLSVQRCQLGAWVLDGCNRNKNLKEIIENNIMQVFCALLDFFEGQHLVVFTKSHTCSTSSRM